MVKPPTAGIILAAGMSTRLGVPKQLLHVGGRFLLHWVLDAALASRLARVVLVLGHESSRIIETLGMFLLHPRLRVVVNERYREGMAQSLRTGLLQVQEEFPSAMFLLGDQPLLDSATIDLLLKTFWESDKDICVPVHEKKRGNPTLFSRAFYDSILALEGDAGARAIIDAHPDRVLAVEMEDRLLFADIDTEEDLDRVAMAIMRRRG